MKTYNISSRISSQAARAIQGAINTHKRYNKAYFFCPSSSASGRRSNEKQFAAANPGFILIRDTTVIEVSFSYSESTRNVYYRISIMVDGVSKNITYLKKLIGDRSLV